jgi:hypothetical protein
MSVDFGDSQMGFVCVGGGRGRNGGRMEARVGESVVEGSGT